MTGGFHYTAEPSDCVISIADRHGFFWRTVWTHPENAELRRLRKEPNVLHAGDRVFIPELRERIESGATDARHRFVRKGVPELVRLRFLDNGEPRANVPYTLTIEGRTFTGRTDGDGCIQAPTGPDARSGTLILGEGDHAERYELAIGRLDPVDEVAGARMRLEGLGLHCGDDERGFSSALQSFQASWDLEITGELDQATQRALLDAFGS